MIFLPVSPVSPWGPPDLKPPGRVHVDDGGLVEQVGGITSLMTWRITSSFDLLLRDARIVLRGDDDRVDTDGLPSVVFRSSPADFASGRSQGMRRSASCAHRRAASQACGRNIRDIGMYSGVSFVA